MSGRRKRKLTAAGLSAADDERLNTWVQQIAIELRLEAPVRTESDGAIRVGNKGSLPEHESRITHHNMPLCYVCCLDATLSIRRPVRRFSLRVRFVRIGCSAAGIHPRPWLRMLSEPSLRDR